MRDLWGILEDSGRFWRILEDSGGFWRILEDLWRILEDSGGFWRILKDSGGYWRILEHSGKMGVNYLAIWQKKILQLKKSGNLLCQKSLESYLINYLNWHKKMPFCVSQTLLSSF